MNSEKTMRQKAITRTSMIGIAVNVILAGFKALVGALAGSIAIIMDAVNNLTDALSSVITIVGIRLAAKKPDEKHPFGHGRIEYFSAVIISLIVLFAGVTSLLESVKKFTDPSIPDYSYASIIVIVAAVATKLILGRFVKSRGEKYHSDALIASGSDAMFDAIISASTLVSAIIALIWKLPVDAFLAAAISVVIIKAGLEMLTSPVNEIVGARADSEVTSEIKSAIKEIPPVMGAYDLILHNYGPDSLIGSVHIEIPDTLTANEIHVLTNEIQHKILERFHIFLTVGIYAVDTADVDGRRARVLEKVLAHEWVRGMHAIFVDEKRKTVSFDVVFDFKVTDLEGESEKIKQDVEEVYEGYTAVLNVDINYSD